MGKHIKCFLGLVILLVLGACNTKKEKVQDIDGEAMLIRQYKNSAERINTTNSKQPQFGTKSNGLFNGVNQRSTNFAFGGKYSLIANKDNLYAFGTRFKVEVSSFIEVSIWRRKCTDCGTLIIKQDEKLILNSTHSIIQETKHWEKLFVSAIVEGEGSDEHILNIYYTNNSEDTAYVDQIQIDVFKKRIYPDFPELKQLSISIDKKDYLKIKSAAFDAKKLDVILPKHKKKYKAEINVDGKKVKAKIRLKGDWVDHLENNKWSFRIEVKDDESVLDGLKEFSIQNPKTRHFIEEYAFHNIADSLGLLTTRYGFIQVSLNGENLGIYAYEEHFTKQLIESRKRREGPIVKFDEEPFWNQTRYNKTVSEKIVVPYYESAQVLPYDYKKTTKTPVLLAQFNQASTLMNQYKYGLVSGSQIMDVSPFCKAIFLSDLGRVAHNYAWHNQRFYYNPVINKLEPILYDCYTDYWYESKYRNTFFPIKNSHHTYKAKSENIVSVLPFRDSVIQSKYAETIYSLTHSDKFRAILQAVCEEAKFYEPLMKREFLGYTFQYEKFLLNNLAVLKEQSDSVNSYLKHQKYVAITQTYTDTNVFIKGAGLVAHYDAQNKVLELENYHNEPLTILGKKQKNKKQVSFSDPYVIPAFDKVINKPGTLTIPSNSQENSSIMFKDASKKIRESMIYPWPAFSTQITVMQAYHNSAKIFIPHQEHNDTVWIKKGNHTITKALVFSNKKTIMIEAGTTIDLLNGAKIICFGAVNIKGNKSNPVIIYSSDKTGEGLVVLQASTKSYLQHVIFEDLNTSQHKNWTLTGAVTFYESDVEMNHVTVKRNSCEDALNIIRSDFHIKNLTVSETASDGFDADYCTGILDSSYFGNTGNDCIDFSTSEITISNIIIKNSGDKGISGGEASTLQISNVSIDGAAIGIASKDKSVLNLKNIKINNAKYGLAAFQKKPEYGAANIIAKDIRLTNVENAFILEKNSTIKWDDKKHVGENKLNLEQLYDL